MTRGLTQKDRRVIKNEINILPRFVKVVDHFFPHFANMLNQMNDPRHPSYITYSQSALILLTIMKYVCGISSMRGMTRQFNTDHVISSLSHLCNMTLDDKPDWQTINNYLEGLDAVYRLCPEWDDVNSVEILVARSNHIASLPFGLVWFIYGILTFCK